MTGMTYVDGVPYVWGRPAIEDSTGLALLECFSKWRCPHCNAHLSGGERPICLNACHLTAPQLNAFRDGLRAAAHRVEQADKAKDAAQGQQAHKEQP